MKKVVIIIMFLSKVIIGAERYKEVDFLEEKVYFPKSNSEYIEELLEENTDESFIELAWFYSQLGYKENSLKYINEYKGNDRVKKSLTYHKLEVYDKEIEMIESLYDDLSEKEIKNCYEYILKIAEDKKNILSKKYSSFKIYYLTHLLKNEIKFSEFFNQNEWTEDEKVYIKFLIKDYDFRENPLYDKIYQKVASKKERLEKSYSEIYELEDREGYKRYFDMQKKIGVKLEEKDQIELLYRYDYDKNKEAYDDLYSVILKKALKKDDLYTLISLYTIEGDFRLAYNLALENEEFHFKFLKLMIKKDMKKELIERIISEFESKYPKSKYNKELIKIKIELTKDQIEKVNMLKKYIENEYSEKLMKEYLELVTKTSNEEEKNKIVEKYLFEKGMETEYLLQEFVDYNINKDEFFEKLQLLSDKSYYFYYSEKKKKNIDKKYEAQYIEYLFNNEEFKKILKYKTKLDYNQYMKLINEGYKDLKLEANKKFPFALEWMDLNNIKYFYFNEKYIYNKDIAEKIADLKKMSSAEEYYLMRYYEQNDESDKASKILKRLGRRYLLKYEKKNTD